MSKSDYYLAFLPVVNNGSCRLLDQERLVNQLINLERRVRSGARDAVDVFAGHDDCSNVAAGACVEAGSEKPIPMIWRLGDLPGDNADPWPWWARRFRR
jgi:hypothetical protein